MKFEEVRGLTPDQLSETLINLKKEQFNLRFQGATGQLENVARVREVRRDIARVRLHQQMRSALQVEPQVDPRGRRVARPFGGLAFREQARHRERDRRQA